MGGIRQAQTLLRQVDARLVIDGLWGAKSQAAYSKAPADVRAKVDAVIGPRPGAQDALSAAEMSALAHKVGAEVDVAPELLIKIAYVESRGRPAAVNGSSRGLMQMQKAAWADARARYPHLLGSYDLEWQDPLQNMRAGAIYVGINETKLRNRGYMGPIGFPEIYLSHQQGTGGFLELYSRAHGLSVSKSYVTPEKMRRNPPPDGKGVTLDPSDFFNRWYRYASSL